MSQPEASVASSVGSSSGADIKSTITIVELGHNSSSISVVDRHVTMQQYQRLLSDAGKVDSPLLASLGYPVILVSTTPGQKCIPQAQVRAVSNNQRNNRMATVAASRLTTGLAIGCVVGNVYALRTDGKDLNANEWGVLWDMLMQLMDDFGDGGPGSVGQQLLALRKADTRALMRSRGLLRTGGAGSGHLCWGCGTEGGSEVTLLKCSRCKTARYCSKECQRAHWTAGGHKQECKPQQTPAEAEGDKAAKLLAAAVLKPEQVIRRNAPAPDLPPPNRLNPQAAALRDIMPPEDLARFLFNKDEHNKERYCLACKTLYRLEDPVPDTQCGREQELSGICSYSCWCALNPPGSRHAAPEWYGQSAQPPSDQGFAGVILG